MITLRANISEAACSFKSPSLKRTKKARCDGIAMFKGDRKKTPPKRKAIRGVVDSDF